MAERSAPSRPPAPALTARALAWDILRRVEEQGAYADALLGRRLGARARGAGAAGAQRLAARDQALVTRLVYGTLAWQGYLDHLISAFSHRPPPDLDPPVRTLLRLALFQICLLSRIPPFAAVHSAVDLAKRFGSGSAAGLVNAVLRKASTGWRRVPLPSAENDAAQYLAVRWSHPRWLVERWIAQYGHDETTALLAADNEPAPTVVRVNRLRSDTAQLAARLCAAGFIAEATRYSPAGVRVTSPAAPEALPGYTEGLFSVQGEAAQLVGFLAAPQPGSRVLDACAAPGGKTAHLGELMDNRGTIVALDISVRGLQRAQRTARRLGLTIIDPLAADGATWPLPAPETQADVVLLDAPCSGLGTLRQHPEIKWRRTPADIAALAAVQSRLLRQLAGHVRPGGILVYATCTLNRDENEDVLAAFLQEQADFCVVDPRPLLPEPARALVGSDHALRTFPHRHDLDGFFAVRLQRRLRR